MATPTTQQATPKKKRAKKKRTFLKFALAAASLAVGATLPFVGAGLLAYAGVASAATTAGAVGLGIAGAVVGGIAGTIAGGIAALPGQIYFGKRLFKGLLAVAGGVIATVQSLLLNSVTSSLFGTSKPAADKKPAQQTAAPAVQTADKPAVADKTAAQDFAAAANENKPEDKKPEAPAAKQAPQGPKAA